MRFDPVAQLVEQWPFKPLVVSSSLTRITLRKPYSSEKSPVERWGFLFIISLSRFSNHIPNKGHDFEGHTHIVG